MDVVQLPQGQNENYFEEAVYIFNIKFTEIADTHFLSYSEGKITQILKSDPKKGVLVISKLLFLQVDEGFWLYCTSF